MARTREFDIDQAVEDLKQKFWADGYESTGLSELIDATGVARASLYAAFGSKQEMLHRAIDAYLDENIESLMQHIESTGVNGIADLFRGFADYYETDAPVAMKGCLMVNSIVELGTRDEGVSERARRYRARVRKAFTKAIKSSGISGAEARADVATILLMGLYVSMKGGAPFEDVKRLCGAAVDVVESWKAS